MNTIMKKKTAVALGIYVALILLILLVSNIGIFNGWLDSLFRLLRPLIIGLVIAYLFNPFFRFFECKMFVKIKPASLRRGISLFFTYLVLFLIIGVLVLLIVPQLVDSIVSFLSNSDELIDKSMGEINNLIGMLNARFPAEEGAEPTIPYIDPTSLKENVSRFFKSINFNVENLVKLLNANTVSSLFSMASNLMAIVTDTVFGLFISLYLLNTKEKRYAQIMRLRKAVFSDKVNAAITKICTVADKSFGGFIRGKLLDSCMVGILVYILISLMGVPYEILIAVIIGITDVVPIVGPFIGVIPSAIIILLTDPSKVIPFLLCILIVQQIDGNIIAPKILGENTGVSSLCVIIAISVMGSLWGLVGMVIGVPLFATVLELTSEFLDKRLKKKGLSTDAESYYAYDIDPPPKEEEGNLLQRMHRKKLLRLQQESAGGEGNLTAFERFQLDSYALAQKYQVLSKKNDVIPEGFAEEENELAEAAQEQLDCEVAEELAEAEEATDTNVQNNTENIISESETQTETDPASHL